MNSLRNYWMKKITTPNKKATGLQLMAYDFRFTHSKQTNNPDFYFLSLYNNKAQTKTKT